MSWAQLSNRPNAMSPPFNPYSQHHQAFQQHVSQPHHFQNNGHHFNTHHNGHMNNNHNQNNNNNHHRNGNGFNPYNQQQQFQAQQQRNYNPPQAQVSLQANQHQIGSSPVQITNSKRKHKDVHYVILDSGAFIGRQNFFNNFNENVRYYMTPAVNNEIRDKQSRTFLDNFPYEIIVKKPDPQSVAFVSRFIQKNPSLRSLSKVDRGIVALAHNLEVEYHGTKHVEILIPKKKKNKANKQLSQQQQQSQNDANDKNKKNDKKTDEKKDKLSSSNNKPKVKKSKTGRIHSQTKPLNDTGVRLAVMKKVVPFNFDDFMTLTQTQYGAKHGKPIPTELGNQIETKSVSNLASWTKQRKKIDAKKKEIGFNPQPYIPQKAKTDIDANSQCSLGSLSKAQRRRQRKKMSKLKALTPLNNDNENGTDKGKISKMTQSNLIQFGLINDDEVDSSDNDALMKQMSKDVERDKKIEAAAKMNGANNNDIDSKSEPEKSEIDKMIEEDLSTTFHETAHLISSLSAQRTIKSVQYRLHEQHQQNEAQKQHLADSMDLDLDKPIMSDEVTPRNRPSMDLVSQSLPVNFGTMFDGQSGSLFGNALPTTNNNLKSNKKVDVMPSIKQEVEEGESKKNSAQKSKGKGKDKEEAESEVVVKKNVKDAWHGEWLTPENFKPIPKNEKSKKRKLKNVAEVKNLDSSVAVITVDTAMQRCMVNMGLRVMSTSKDRQFGGGNGEKKDGKNANHEKNGNEPVQFVFRCYGCFQFENNTTRTHCRWCGGQTFQRVAIYLDQNGQHHYRYYYKDRFATKYLDKHQLIPRGGQLVKNHQKNGYDNNRNSKNNKKKNKKRGYLAGPNNNQYGGGGRGGYAGQRW